MIQKTDAIFIGERIVLKSFAKILKELGTEIINFEEKEMIPLTIKKLSLMKSKNYVIYVNKNFAVIKTKKSKRSLPLHQKI